MTVHTEIISVWTVFFVLGKIKYIFLVMLALLSVLVIVYIEDRDQLILSQFRVVEAALQTAFHHATNLP